MKVEQALRLLPDLEALVPLRARILASARADDVAAWASSSPYLTVGKRDLSSAELRRRTAQSFHLVTEHLSSLHDAYIDALESLEHDDPSGAVSAFLKAGRREVQMGRTVQAAAWFEVALALASGLADRRPEIQALLALGRLGLALGRFDESARHHQRALALAEAEFDQIGAISACRGLGSSALERGEWSGAQAWFARALRLAEATGDDRRLGEVHHCLGELARRKGETQQALEHLGKAKEHFEKAGEARPMGRVLNTEGLVQAARRDHNAAMGAYREALAWSRRGERDPDFQVAVRLNLAALQLDAGRYVEAEAELRRAEQLAISGNLAARLVSIYVLLGSLHGRQGDETGFVFFEQAIELARTVAPSAGLEAEAYREYGLFRHRLGQGEEARAYLERAREIYAAAGLLAELERTASDLERLSA